MTSGRKKLKSKELLDEVMPSALSTILPGDSGVKKLIYEYFFDPAPKLLKAHFTMFGISSLREQILTCARYAGPLEQIETYIRKAHARREEHLADTLERATEIAVIGLDQTIRHKTTGTVIIKGMAETLLDLYAELYPEEAYLRVLDKANRASPLETKEDKAREKLNIAELDKVMTAFIQNDEVKMTAAVQTFNEFVANTKTEVMTNTNRYHLNLIHLISEAFDVLANRGEELPRIDEEPYGQWHGKLAHRFCFEIIGTAIQQKLPPRARQLVKAGLHLLLNGTLAVVERTIDIDGFEFPGRARSGDLLCGVDSYYDAITRCPPRQIGPGAGSRFYSAIVFKFYYEQLHQHPKLIIQQPHTHHRSAV